MSATSSSIRILLNASGSAAEIHKLPTPLKTKESLTSEHAVTILPRLPAHCMTFTVVPALHSERALEILRGGHFSRCAEQFAEPGLI